MKYETTPADLGPPPDVCPGCGGNWNEASENAPGAAICRRCGVDSQEALWLLWGDVAAPYAAAHEAAREGRFGDARTLLRPLRQSAVCRDAIRRLDNLCASVLGESPTDESESNADLALAQTGYAAARRAAGMGEITDALTAVDHCLSHAPYLIPAQKLRMLLLAGAGRGAEAEALRTAATILFPSEPDMARWKFPGPSLPRSVLRRRRVVPVILQNVSLERQRVKRQNKEGMFALPISLGAMAIAMFSLAMYLKTPPALPPPSVSSASAASVKRTDALPDKKRVLAIDLAREWEGRRREAEFAQSRAWFNRAVRAKNKGDWQECDRFAAAAYQLGKNSYLADESLVLRALAADNSGESKAIRVERYAAIAEDTPNSVYAFWALRTAIRLAEQDGQKYKAEKYRRLLRLRQRRTDAARDEASRSET